MLTHTRSCPALTNGDDPCTCGLEFRIQLQTEQTMHAAWRKRAEEAEQKTAQQAEELYQRAFDDGATAVNMMHECKVCFTPIPGGRMLCFECLKCEIEALSSLQLVEILQKIKTTKNRKGKSEGGHFRR